jgi:hypothetical protein
MVHQGDGLKTHLSTDKEGDEAIYGHKIEHYDKRVSRVDEPISLLILAEIDSICGRYIQQSGLDKELHWIKDSLELRGRQILLPHCYPEY